MTEDPDQIDAGGTLALVQESQRSRLVVVGEVRTRAPSQLRQLLRHGSLVQQAPGEVAATGLHLDLKEATFIELPALLMMNGIATVFEAGNARLTLPDRENLCAFLTRWRYIESLSEATSTPIDLLISPEDAIRWKVFSSEIAARTEYTTSPEGDRLPLLPRSYYEIKSYAQPQRLSPGLSEELSASWNENHVKAVLRKIMGRERGQWIAENIIHELIDNALEHPNATVIQHGAQHERLGSEYLPFKIGLWDNGDSIVDTLRQALLAGGPIVGPSSVVAHVNVRVRVENLLTGEAATQTLSSEHFRPSNDTEDWELLIASLLPGVTRLAGVQRHAGGAGLGLHRIASSITKMYAGEFLVFTKNLFLRVRPSVDDPGRDFDYSADVMLLDPNGLNVKGNLLAASLPSRWTHG